MVWLSLIMLLLILMAESYLVNLRISSDTSSSFPLSFIYFWASWVIDRSLLFSKSPEIEGSFVKGIPLFFKSPIDPVLNIGTSTDSKNFLKKISSFSESLLSQLLFYLKNWFFSSFLWFLALWSIVSFQWVSEFSLVSPMGLYVIP